MNKIFATIIIIVGHLALNFILPWWNIALISFLAVIILRLKSKASWFIPAISIMALWSVQIILLDLRTDMRSSERIALLFNAPGFVAYLVPIITAGIISGLAGYLGFLLFGQKDTSTLIEQKESMSIKDYKDNTPGLEDKGII